jgi:hypothetical protein
MAQTAALPGDGRWSGCARCIAITVLLLAPGCAGTDGAELAELRPAPGGFVYRATTTLFYGPNADGWAEFQRLSWLETYVRQNGICPHGYQLSSRDVAFKFQSPLGYPIDEIIYHGRCQS